MNLSGYLKGNCADVSRRQFIRLPNIKRCFVEPSNLYSLRKFAPFESLDSIYSKNLINETKFYKILLKEWFYFCKVGGYIIIEMVPNKILNHRQLLSEIALLLEDKAKVVGLSNSKKSSIVIIQKTAPALRKDDSMDKWTFGIITDGKRKEWVDKEIDSIEALNIPHYEIIVCGEHKPKKWQKVKVIPFDSTISWITRKKNLICQNAKYENLVITHDRFTFNNDWHEGMKKYGNYFEVMSCRITDPIGRRVDDWVTRGADIDDPHKNSGFLNYLDWDRNGYISGGFYILKKSAWEKCKWKESLIWGQAEDIVLSFDFLKKGTVARFNPFSICTTTKERGDKFVRWITFKFNKTRFVKLSDRPFLRALKVRLKVLTRKYLINT